MNTTETVDERDISRPINWVKQHRASAVVAAFSAAFALLVDALRHRGSTYLPGTPDKG